MIKLNHNDLQPFAQCSEEIKDLISLRILDNTFNFPGQESLQSPLQKFLSCHMIVLQKKKEEEGAVRDETKTAMRETKLALVLSRHFHI